MIHHISGKLVSKKNQSAVIEANGIGFKLLISKRTSRALPKEGSRAKLFSYLHLYENNPTLYGFLSEKELQVFELLNSINGIGPKASLRIMDVMKPENLLSAVGQGRSDLLTKAAGVGAKKAARIILELKDKIIEEVAKGDIPAAESDAKLEGVLRSLGYRKEEIREVIRSINPREKTFEAKLKSALKFMAKK